jgi:hypothetical protein
MLSRSMRRSFYDFEGEHPEDRVYHRVGILVLTGRDQSHRDRWFEEVWSASVLPLKRIIIQ